jgi:hypothetical protein
MPVKRNLIFSPDTFKNSHWGNLLVPAASTIGTFTDDVREDCAFFEVKKYFAASMNPSDVNSLPQVERTDSNADARERRPGSVENS